MIELPENIDYTIKVTHHCKLFNMNEDPTGLEYFAAVNSRGEADIDIKRQEINMSKDGIVMVVVFYDKYEKVPKSKPAKKIPIEKHL